MEAVIDPKVEAFLTIEPGSGYGYGDGSGSGYGDGSGYGSGDGSGDGYGSGYGYGYGSGDGSGDGSGYGSGYGSGDGSGSGSGYGYGSSDGCIGSVNGDTLHLVDGVPTIIRKVKGNIAKGAIFNRDFTFTPCFVIRQGNTFAHGATLSEAAEALRAKILNGAPEEDRIEAFVSEHQKGKAYATKDFFQWHHTLTGSCEAGRKAFAKDHEIDLDGTMTVEEFIELTEHAYGSSTIKKLKPYYE